MLQTSQISAGQNLQAIASTRPQWFRRGNFNRDHRMLQPKSIQLNYGYPTCAGIVDSLLYSNMLEYMQHIADAKKHIDMAQQRLNSTEPSLCSPEYQVSFSPILLPRHWPRGRRRLPCWWRVPQHALLIARFSTALALTSGLFCELHLGTKWYKHCILKVYTI